MDDIDKMRFNHSISNGRKLRKLLREKNVENGIIKDKLRRIEDLLCSIEDKCDRYDTERDCGRINRRVDLKKDILNILK